MWTRIGWVHVRQACFQWRRRRSCVKRCVIKTKTLFISQTSFTLRQVWINLKHDRNGSRFLLFLSVVNNTYLNWSQSWNFKYLLCEYVNKLTNCANPCMKVIKMNIRVSLFEMYLRQDGEEWIFHNWDFHLQKLIFDMKLPLPQISFFTITDGLMKLLGFENEIEVISSLFLKLGWSAMRWSSIYLWSLLKMPFL